MFERFTDDARNVVLSAVQLAKLGGDDRVGARHLLAALKHDIETGPVLPTSGDDVAPVDHELMGHEPERGELMGQEPVRDQPDTDGLTNDEVLLASLGIDLDAVRREIDGVFGPGAFDAARRRTGGDSSPATGRRPFDHSAKAVLERSLRHALRLGCTSIGPCHLALAVLDDHEMGRIIGASQRRLAQAAVDLEQIAVDNYRIPRRWWGLRAG